MFFKNSVFLHPVQKRHSTTVEKEPRHPRKRNSFSHTFNTIEDIIMKFLRNYYALYEMLLYLKVFSVKIKLR